MISRILLCLFLLACCFSIAYSQKMLLLEQRGKLINTRFYVGQTLHFRLKGSEPYWYKRTITDIPGTENTVVLGDQLVQVEDIAAIKMARKGRWKRFSAHMIIAGSQLALATAQAIAYKQYEYAPLFLASAAATCYGTYLKFPKKVRLGKRSRLIATNIQFANDGEIPAPPGN